MKNTRLILLLCILSFGSYADDWSGRLKPTRVNDISAKAMSRYDLNCDGEKHLKIKTSEFEEKGVAKKELLPLEDCLVGTFKSAVYHKRHKGDRVAYKTKDDKPYLELFFSESDEARPPANYGLKIIIYDFKGKGRYPVSYLEKAYKPRYDEKQPVAKTDLGTPYLNYNKGAHVPFIYDNFVAFHESYAYTYTSGSRIYGKYDASELQKIIPANKLLGHVTVSDIDTKGVISGRYEFRLAHEFCNDMYAIKDCRLSSSRLSGSFVADEFKPDKDFMANSKLKIKGRLHSSKDKRGVSPRLVNPNSGKPQFTETIMDSIKPGLHKQGMGHSCKGPVSEACKTSDATYDSYLSCMDKNNIKTVDAKSADAKTARDNLRRCGEIYKTYQVQAENCKQLFIKDKGCER